MHRSRHATRLAPWALTALALLPLAARAGGPPAMAGYYLAADLGTANYSGGGGSDDDSTFSVALGYQFTPQLAAEVSYRDLGEVGGQALSALQGSVVGQLPLQGPFAAYGRLGLTRLDADRAYWRLAFGVGAQFDWSPSWRLRAGYERYAKVEGVATSLWTVGAAYRF